MVDSEDLPKLEAYYVESTRYSLVLVSYDKVFPIECAGLNSNFQNSCLLGNSQCHCVQK